MPRYIEKMDKHKYVEITFESLSSHPENKKNIEAMKALLLDIPANKSEMKELIENLNKEINKIKEGQPTEPEKPWMLSEVREYPKKTETRVEFLGISGEHNEERMTRHEYTITHSDEEFSRMIKAYEARKTDKEDAIKKYDLEYEKYTEALIEYQFSDQVIIELPKLQAKLNAVIDLKNFIDEKKDQCIRIPTSEEIYKSFTRQLSRHESSRPQLKALKKSFEEIYGNQDMKEDEKVRAYVDAILKNYREIIRSSAGAPSLFGKGSTLAVSLRDFCKLEFGMTLPASLNKGQPLSIDLHPLNSNPICQYLHDKEQFGTKFSPAAGPGPQA